MRILAESSLILTDDRVDEVDRVGIVADRGLNLSGGQGARLQGSVVDGEVSGRGSAVLNGLIPGRNLGGEIGSQSL